MKLTDERALEEANQGEDRSSCSQSSNERTAAFHDPAESQDELEYAQV